MQVAVQPQLRAQQQVFVVVAEAGGAGLAAIARVGALQAGREVRVIASTRLTTDETAAKICRDIARAFEDQLSYPGEIKVTMIRESRFTETAK